MIIHTCLTIIFDGSFYQGIFEVHDEKNYSIAKITLGSSLPKTSIIINLINQRYRLLNFYQIDDNKKSSLKHTNPKRLQRQAAKAVKKTQISTKAQTALKQQLNLKKGKLKKQKSKNKKQIAIDRFQKRQIKKIKKHQGH